MKKLFVILSVASASILASCENENTVNPQPLGKAKISGTVFADFDYTNNTSGQTWDKVANKKVIVYIEDEFNGTYRFTETTTDASGNYSIEIELGNRPLEVDIWLVDFKQNVKYEAKIEEEIFYGEGFATGVFAVKGGEYIRDIYYND